jgi:hypothetical protein
VRRLICGKFDSQWRYVYRTTSRQGHQRRQGQVRGFFDTAMNYACRHKGGIKLIAHVRHQPWETWRQL